MPAPGTFPEGGFTLRGPDAESRTASNLNGNVGNMAGSVQGDALITGITNTGGSETRPRNAAVNYLIKY